MSQEALLFVNKKKQKNIMSLDMGRYSDKASGPGINFMLGHGRWPHHGPCPSMAKVFCAERFKKEALAFYATLSCTSTLPRVALE